MFNVKRCIESHAAGFTEAIHDDAFSVTDEMRAAVTTPSAVPLSASDAYALKASSGTRGE